MLKKIIGIFALILTMVLITACDDKAPKIDVSLSSPIEITYGDTAYLTQEVIASKLVIKIDSVVQNLETLDWQVNKDNVNVNLAGNYDITIIITISKKEYSKTVSVKVLEEVIENNDQEVVDAAKDALTIDTQVMISFTLPITGANGVAIAWESSNTAVILISGEDAAVMPVSNDTEVTLTATLTKGNATASKEIVVNVLSATTAIDQETVNLAKTALTAPTSVTANFTLSLAGANGVTIAWASNNAAIAISGANATITRSTSDVTVKLTATLTKGSASATKEFNVVVVRQEIQSYTDIAEVIAGTVGTEYTIQGVVTGFIYGAAKAKLGFYVTDETGTIYVYGTAAAATLEVGDLVNLKATRAVYAVQSINSDQLTYPTVNEIISHGNEAEFNDVITDKTIDDLYLSPMQNLSNHLYEFEAKVVVTASETYKSIALEGAGGKRVNIYVSGSPTPAEMDELFSELIAQAGQTVRLLVVINSWNATTYRGIVLDILGQQGATDQEKVDAAKAALSITTSVSANFTLPLTGANGVTIAWASNNTAIAISGANATVTRSASDVTVKLTATLTLGTAQATKDINVTVLRTGAVKDYSDVSEVLAGTVGTEYTIQGVVTGFIYGNAKAKLGFYVTDETGTIYVYGNVAAATLAVGDLVNLTATRAVYAVQSINSDQLTFPTVNNIISHGNEAEFVNVTTDKTIDDLYLSSMQNLSNKIYEFEAKVVVTAAETYKSIALEGTGGKRVNIYVSGSPTPAEMDELFSELIALAGQTVRLLVVINSWNATTYRGIVLDILDQQETTDQEKVDAAKAALSITASVSANFTLPLTGANGVTIAWTSNNTAIAISGANATVTRAEADVVVKLTATLTKGNAQATKDINVTVIRINTSTDYTDVAEVLAGTVGTEYTIQGVVAGFIYGNAKAKLGFYVADSTGIIYVYGTAAATTLEVGDLVNLTATRAVYAVQSINTDQLTFPTVNNIISHGNDAEFVNIITDKTIDDLYLSSMQNLSNNVYEFEAKVVVTAAETYKSITLEGAGGKRVNIYVSGSPTPAEMDALFSDLIALAGQTVTLLVVINSWNATTYRGIVLDILG